jgi:PAS domain-containing protein
MMFCILFAYLVITKKAKQADFALFKSEERYRGLLNNLDAGILVHAVDTSIIDYNQKPVNY